MKNYIPILSLKWSLLFLSISIISFIISICTGCKKNSQIDRFSLVTRHNIEISKIDSLNSLSIGNGEFVFTTDITGLQTFPEYYSKGISLGTMSNWGWHAGDNPAPLPVLNWLYLCSEDTKDSYVNQRYLSDHPVVSAVSGMLPKTKMVDNKILASTLDTIMKKWNWQSTWGWDFPMLAMSAASVGRSEQAIDFLMMDVPKNRYLINGHNYQDAGLAIYLPGNGGLLTAVAKMCVQKQFPDNGKWKVKYENLNRYVE